MTSGPISATRVGAALGKIREPPGPLPSQSSQLSRLTSGGIVSNLAQTLLIPIVAIIGIIVLIALGKVTSGVGIPIIAALAGAHLGASITKGTP